MSYHDYGNYKTRWSKNISKDEADQMKEQTDNPRIQVISPQKKLYDIQKILNDAREAAPSMYELHTAIQTILDGE